MTRSISTLALFLLFTVTYCSAQDFNKAMDLFAQNKRTESANQLKALVNDKAQGTDALLALTVLEIDNEHLDQAFGYFNQFIRRHPDPYPYVYALWNKGIFNIQSSPARDSVKTLMNMILSDPRANATMKAINWRRS